MAPTSSCAAATSNLFGCVSSALDGGGREAPAAVQRTFSQGYAYGEDDRHAAADGRGAAPRSQGLLPVCRALDRGFRALNRGPHAGLALPELHELRSLLTATVAGSPEL